MIWQKGRSEDQLKLKRGACLICDELTKGQ